ncbi:hypothetical protein C922_00432 [Plasmodium inui San Antonio 1]|uniref:Uncharacterized protein n=1 Tax=Plasmodium inui San Antonio 1 TaxID=1237626 RepID=W7AE62_9APIC|nr:hypothetical protein C922_00432 [Plasmodium inui San Antonio 1]EUD69568.1 hypothetical protein C922_00432 [Plasmodium inui San Antonio 1]
MIRKNHIPHRIMIVLMDRIIDSMQMKIKKSNIIDQKRGSIQINCLMHKKLYEPYGPNVNDSKCQNGYKPQCAPDIIPHAEKHLDMMRGRGHYHQ